MPEKFTASLRHGEINLLPLLNVKSVVPPHMLCFVEMTNWEALMPPRRLVQHHEGKAVVRRVSQCSVEHICTGRFHHRLVFPSSANLTCHVVGHTTSL
ncbi:hypothetical protein EGR_05817 [Echinococcus granulosus]|uniref:Uncharacterized protein n=1 Tax=Echinococcus granulosus TaxID=6210 RepID=W6UE49_ECHGR|nr:hypothetical protein EGR_05817 [Echinococcus granulosus]EUB59333.1 hypothetical protein EGR_05817 [Echinococcus granulosus]